MQSVYYSNLGPDQKAYDAALKCFQSRGRDFSPPSTVKVVELFINILNEHPEIFYVGQEVKISSGFFQRSVSPLYLYSPSETEKLRRQIDAVAEEIISANINEHQSDYDKVRALHDYLKTNVEYDYANISSTRVNERNFAEAHNIIGPLLKKKCVCEGFAKAFKFLCDKIGLESWVVSGTGNSAVDSGPHAWNIVRINGYYHHVDVTWDNQFSDSALVPNYGYMNLSDEEISKDHTWNRKHYPPCPSSPYNFFRVNNALIDSKSQLESFLYNSIQMEEEFIMFRVVRGSILEREINGCLGDCLERASGRCKYISVTEYRYGGIQEQLTFFVQPSYSYT